MKFLLALALLAASPAFAKGSSHPQSSDQSNSGMIPWSTAQRVITWNSERHWQTADGQILVCPWEAKTGYNKECRDKKDDKIDRWIPLTSYAVTGFEIVGFQYFYAGSQGTQQLAVYYGAPKPVQPVVAPKDPSITLTGPITINTNRVIVQRKKQ